MTTLAQHTAQSVSQPWIVVIHGISGVGKDEVSKRLRHTLHHSLHIFKFSEPFKEALASYLSVPTHYMEDRVWRNTVLPELGCTPLDLLIRGHEVMPLLHPQLGLYKTRHQLTSKLLGAKFHSVPVVAVFNDTRNYAEAEFLAQMKQEHNAKLSLVTVVRPGKQALSSDCFVQDISDYLKPKADHQAYIRNAGTLNDLYDLVDQMARAYL